MNYKEAFTKYGVRLPVQYYMSGEAPNGDIVLALWEHLFHKGSEPGTLQVQEDFSNWKYTAGRNEFVRLMRLAQAEHRPIRVIVVTQKEKNSVQTIPQTGNVKDASPRDHLVGEVVFITNTAYKIIFRSATK